MRRLLVGQAKGGNPNYARGHHPALVAAARRTQDTQGRGRPYSIRLPATSRRGATLLMFTVRPVDRTRRERRRRMVIWLVLHAR